MTEVEFSLPWKVGYLSVDGVKRTAYLDTEVAPDLYVGTEKHTDEPVRVRWDREKEQWREVLGEGER